MEGEGPLMKHCLFCFKSFRNSNDGRKTQKGKLPEHNSSINRDASDRFLQIIHRLFAVPIPSLLLKVRNEKYESATSGPDNSVKLGIESPSSGSFQKVCNDCCSIVECICDVYEKLEYMKLQLNWRLQQLLEATKYADNVPERYLQFRKQFQDLKSFEDAYHFRRKFIKKCSKRLANTLPRIRLASDKVTECGNDTGFAKYNPAHLQSMKRAPSTSPKAKSLPSGADLLLKRNVECLKKEMSGIIATSQSELLGDESLDQWTHINVWEPIDIPDEQEESVVVSEQYSPTSSQDQATKRTSTDKEVDVDCSEPEIKFKSSHTNQNENNITYSHTPIVTVPVPTSIKKIPAELVHVPELSEMVPTTAVQFETAPTPPCRSPIGQIDNLVAAKNKLVKISPNPSLVKSESQETVERTRSMRSRHKCCICSKTFGTEEALENHASVHKNEEMSEYENFSSDADQVFNDVLLEHTSEASDNYSESECEDIKITEMNEFVSRKRKRASSSRKFQKHKKVLRNPSVSSHKAEVGDNVAGGSDSREKEENKIVKNKYEAAEQFTKDGCLHIVTSVTHKILPAIERHPSLLTKDKEGYCEICKTTLISRYALEKHRVMEHKVNYFAHCPICGAFYSNRNNVYRHLTRTLCTCKDEATPELLKLVRGPCPRFPYHVETHGGIFCPEEGCYEVFKYKEWLNVHLKTHGTWNCSVCSETFGKAHDLALHESNTHEYVSHKRPMHPSYHKPKFQFGCSRCNFSSSKLKIFINHFLDSHLQIRTRVYDNDSPNQEACPICHQQFGPSDLVTVKKLIENHIKTVHAVDRLKPKLILRCTECNAPFSNSFNRTNHMKKVHKIEAPFECPFCVDQKFTLLPHFRKHIRSKHEDKAKEVLTGEHECSKCGEGFYSKENLKRHLVKHDSWECKICYKVFKSRPQLTRHSYYIHSVKKVMVCDECGKSFKNKIKLNQHTKLLHEGPEKWRFECPENGCSKRCFSKQKLDEHMRTHTKEKPFVCDACGKAYGHRHNLRNHVKSAHGKTAAATLISKEYVVPFHKELEMTKTQQQDASN